MKLRIFLIYVFQIVFLKGFTQDFNLVKKSFYPLSDSVLIKNDSNNELDKLLKIAREKEIVAVGEATHGTDEILQFQNLIARNLIENYDFKTVVLGETSLIDSYNIYNFVINGKGNINEIQQAPLHVRNFIFWMKEFNIKREKNEKILIIGTDVDDPTEELNFIRKYFEEMNNFSTAKDLDYIQALFNYNKPLTVNEIQKTDTLFFELKSVLNNNGNLSDSLIFKNNLIVELLSNFQVQLRNLKNKNSTILQRDEIIFKNFEWVKAKSNGKIIIINAHNFHLNRKTINTELFKNNKTFGEYLSDKYKSEYYCIGTEVQNGDYRSQSVNPEIVIEDKDKLGTILGSNSEAKFGILIIDSLSKPFLNNKNLKITYGTSVNVPKFKVFEGKSLLDDAFDAILFIKNSHVYKYDDDFFTLFIRLEKDLESEIIKIGNLKLTAKFTSLDSMNLSNFRIFLNDTNKKLLVNFKGNLNEGVKNLSFDIPIDTKYISINLNIKQLDGFLLESIKINESDIPLKNIELYDWNLIGYKAEYMKNGIFIKKE